MSKLPDVGTTIFTVMSQLANENGAINLSQGFPNFPIDPVLADILARNARADVHQYRPMGGDPVLLEKIAALNHFDLAISTLLDLARLHENAGSCSVYQSMIIGHLIQNVTTAPADSPDSCLKLVQLARSIRRYTDFD